MKKFTLSLVAICFCVLGFSQGQVYSGWIKSDLEVGKGSSEKLKQEGHDTGIPGEKANIWLESSEGWVKLRFSVQQQGKKDVSSLIEEEIPIYDQGEVLWETGVIQKLEGPSYRFEFKLFSVGPSEVPGKNTRISLYYRWVVDTQK